MSVLTSPLGLGAFLLLIACHALAVFLPARAGKIFSYLNLALHVAFLPLILYLQAKAESPSIEEAVMLYMGSIFLYALFFAIRYEVARRRTAHTAEETSDAHEGQGGAA